MTRLLTIVFLAAGLFLTACTLTVLSDADTGKPIPFARVTWTDSQGNTGNTTTNAEGTVVLGNPPVDGLVTFEITAPGYGTQTVQERVVHNLLGGRAAVVHLRLHKQAASVVPTPIHGLNLGPYLEIGQDPNYGAWVSEATLEQLIANVSGYTGWIRVYGCGGGLENAGRVAHKYGLKVVMSAWIGTSASANREQINCLKARLSADEVDLAVVGSEVLLRRDLSAESLIAYINEIQLVAGSVPVATADTWDQLVAKPSVVSAVDLVFANFYPYWDGVGINTALATLHQQYSQLKQAASGKKVLVGETGWPSCGNTIGQAVPSESNAAFYFKNFVSWAEAQNVDFFYFEAYDEPWKSKYEGPQGACWGLWTRTKVLKSGMDQTFNGGRVPNNWDALTKSATPTVTATRTVSPTPTGTRSATPTWTPTRTFTAIPTATGTKSPTATWTASPTRTPTKTPTPSVTPTALCPGSVEIQFTSIPAYGDTGGVLHGTVGGVKPSDYKVATYIKVNGWWTKPTYASPLTSIRNDCTFSTDVTTGGIDQLATQFAAFLIPNGYSPPLLGGATSLPAELYANSVANTIVDRPAPTPTPTP